MGLAVGVLGEGALLEARVVLVTLEHAHERAALDQVEVVGRLVLLLVALERAAAVERQVGEAERVARLRRELEHERLGRAPPVQVGLHRVAQRRRDVLEEGLHGSAAPAQVCREGARCE